MHQAAAVGRQGHQAQPWQARYNAVCRLAISGHNIPEEHLMDIAGPAQSPLEI